MFPYTSNKPCMGGLMLQQHDLDLVDPSRSGNRVSDELKEVDGDQETEAEEHHEEKDQEEEEKDQEGEGEDGRFGVDNSINGNSEPEWTSRDSSDEEQDTGTIKEETGMARLRLWLDGMGLRKYAPLFELHNVDDEVLQLLTLKDLKDMGVSSVGLRWKIYTYVQEFCK